MVQARTIGFYLKKNFAKNASNNHNIVLYLCRFCTVAPTTQSSCTVWALIRRPISTASAPSTSRSKDDSRRGLTLPFNLFPTGSSNPFDRF